MLDGKVRNKKETLTDLRFRMEGRASIKNKNCVSMSVRCNVQTSTMPVIREIISQAHVP